MTNATIGAEAVVDFEYFAYAVGPFIPNAIPYPANLNG
jgi:hypothetical protein